MKRDTITLRQLLMISFVAALPPIVRVIPGSSLEQAGKGAWLCPLLALPVVWLTVWYLSRQLRGRGMGKFLQDAFGKVIGKILCVLELGWLLLQSCIALRICGERFIGAVYRDASILLFMLTLAGMALWLVSGSLGSFGRVGQICLYGAVVTIGLILILSLGSISRENALPLWLDDLPGVVKGVVPVLEVLAIGLVGVFLCGRVESKGQEKLPGKYVWKLCVLITLMSFWALAVFGVGLAGRLQVPFFSLAKEIKIGFALERVEALVITVWVMTDLVLLGLLLQAIRGLLEDVLEVDSAKELMYPVVFFTVAGGILCGGQLNSVQRLGELLLAPSGLGIFYLLPLAAGLVERVRRKHKKVL